MIRTLCLLLALLFATAAAPFDPFGEAGIDQHPGAQVPLDGAIRDTDGSATTLARIGGGKPIVLVPVLHDCPNFCGVTLDGVVRAIQSAGLVPGRDVALVAFGIDPREGPGEAAASLNALRSRHPGFSGPIHGTTGSAAAVHAVTGALGYRYAFDPRIGQFAHAAATAVLTPDGRLVAWLYGVTPTGADMKGDVADARAGHTAGLGEQLILLCYCYDPITGTYGLAINRVLTVGCLLTVGALAGLILFLRRRERKVRPC